MKKIISLFERNFDTDRMVRPQVVPGAEWVLAGEGFASRKYDGTSVLIEDGVMWKRCEVKADKTPPLGFRAAGEPDPVTRKRAGWVRVGNGPEDKWHQAVLVENDAEASDYEDGTYELVGPKVQGNPEGFPFHALVRHGAEILLDVPRTYDGLRDYLSKADIEGIVWHRGDGDMVKIKARDFGIKRGGAGD